jgi:putative nucleotidyltransferase with HDIG domain
VVFGLPKRLGDTTRLMTGRESLQQALDALTDSVNEHDTYTSGHSTRVADIAGAVARLMGLPNAEVKLVRHAGLVHDIGKVAIPDKVLRKPGVFNEEESHLIRLHPIFGASILSRIPGMEELIPIVLHHHERWDGAGYPSGLSGVDIPLGSRIIFVADAFDAMTTERPYGIVASTEAALAELRACSAKQFDPLAVDAMHEAYRFGLLPEADHIRL